MSLNYDIRNMKPNQHTQEVNADGNPIVGEDGRVSLWGKYTQTLIFATMPTGMSTITTENAAEFYKRLKMWQKTIGQLDTNLDYETVLAHAGLKTNASTLTPSAFRKDLLASLEREVDWQVKREIHRHNTAQAEILSPDPAELLPVEIGQSTPSM